MTTINTTPHPITIILDGADPIVLPRPETPARVSVDYSAAPAVDGIPTARGVTGAVTGLPAPSPGTIYVASAMVAEAAARPDVLSPHDFVRDDQGRVVGCRGLRRWPWQFIPAPRG